jgi:His/Glu/Gln/Arg/opine family amino acid ABC transporter permease subunit
MGISFDPKFFVYEITVAVSYIPVVAVLSVIPLIAGLFLGALLAISRVYRIKFMQKFAQAYVVVMRSVPVLLQMFLAYYAVRAVYSVFGWNLAEINKIVVVIIVFILNAAGSLSEGIRSALLSVDASQYEAGHSIGMTRSLSLLYVILPQSLPVAVPIIGSVFIGIIKSSSAAYLMGIIEMIQGTAMKTAGNYRYLEAYCAAAVIYWLITIAVEQMTRLLENYVRGHIKGASAV